jgi:hypothetical protein
VEPLIIAQATSPYVEMSVGERRIGVQKSAILPPMRTVVTSAQVAASM